MPESNRPLPVQDLENLLRQTQGNALSIQNTTWKYLTDPGENFGSLILGVEASVSRNEKSEILHLVCKMPPKSEYLLQLFNSPVVFFKEIFFYTKSAPAFREFQQECGISNENIIDLVPNYYGSRLSLKGSDCQFDDQAAIVLENLNHSGHRNQDRLSGMDMEHMEFAITGLARLHAIVVGLKIKNPKAFKEKLEPGLISGANEMAINCTQEMINRAVANLEKMSEAQPYMGMVRKTLQYELDMMDKPVTQEKWCTMLHNDYWVNNMMYRYDENGKIAGMKIVDFQLTSYEYGVKDLIFCLMSSPKYDVIDNRLDDLINLYYESFIKSLKLFKVNVDDFSRSSFDQILKESAPTKLSQSLMMVQVIKATRGSAPDVNNVTNQEVFLNIGKGKLYEEKLLHVLKTFARKNWLIK